MARNVRGPAAHSLCLIKVKASACSPYFCLYGACATRPFALRRNAWGHADWRHRSAAQCARPREHFNQTLRYPSM